jgi:hypothetical protein
MRRPKVPVIHPPGWVKPEEVEAPKVVDPKLERMMALRKEATLRDKVNRCCCS